MSSRLNVSTLAGALVCLSFAGTVFGAKESHAEKHRLVYYGLHLEEFEYRQGDSDENFYVWDGDAFIGTDELKFRWITKGEYSRDERAFETLENQLVVQRPLWDFFDIKAGIRVDTPEGPNRHYGLIGLAGLAPYWFEVDTNFYLSEKGDASFDIDVEYELLLTNHLILTTSANLDVGLSEDEAVGLGAGFSSTELGTRLSYDLIDRAFSPYIGVVHERMFGRTREFADAAGEDTEDTLWVVGAKLLF